MFGHGAAFKTVKWPNFWYSVLTVLDVVSRLPELWSEDGRTAERRALAELAACLIAYNLDEEGRVVPKSCYRGFENHSFGQKKRPSAFATAMVYATLRPLDDLRFDIDSIDVLSLGSSKGGNGRVRPPKTAR